MLMQTAPGAQPAVPRAHSLMSTLQAGPSQLLGGGGNDRARAGAASAERGTQAPEQSQSMRGEACGAAK